ncbi:MAG TPA: DNA repair protein RecN [Candidatus Enterenecus stercoripullorum]|nr:DNA repair protein RecN [Candidatus Enterenecus stercoripullorum]
MLSLLHIENIAVISQADITFGEGFNVLTGETGAGKSIVIDAIGAIIGQRTSRDLIRTGAKSAQVSAVFRDLPELPWFQEQGIFPDENGELLVERSIQADGKNVCRVNGRPLLVTQLRELGCQMLNIHGQHDGQQLLDEDCHLDYLDSFGATQPQREAFSRCYDRVRRLRGELDRLEMDEGEKARRLDTLNYQIEELERAQLQDGEEETLTARRDLLRNAERLTRAMEGAWSALTGGEDGLGAVSLLSQAGEELSQGGRHSPDLAELAKRTQALRYEAEDVAEQLRDLRESLDFYPGELDELESRLDQLHRLKKKYGGSVGEMLDYLERCRQELDQIQFSEERVEQLQRELAKALSEARQAGQALSQARRAAADRLAGRIQEELRQLDMPKVRFQVAFAPKENEDGMDATGMDEVRFLMSANLGEELKPIQRIASGGELARIMLALKNVLAENEQVTTLIFDEVDTGVSGRAAGKVAQKLFQVAQSKQVLCVTHLPQIAAMGDVHFSVEKGEAGGRTYTAVERLDRAQRRQEVARLTSGDHITDTALQGAEELLAQAEAYKAQLAGKT